MEIILLEKIRGLGELGDKVNVAAGFGRNYLLPQKKAVPATAANVADFETRRAEYEANLEAELNKAKKRQEKFVDFSVAVKAHAGDEGRLFGSVGTREIADAVTAAGLELAKREITMPNGPIHEVGDHTVSLNLHSDVTAEITVTVIAEE